MRREKTTQLYLRQCLKLLVPVFSSVLLTGCPGEGEAGAKSSSSIGGLLNSVLNPSSTPSQQPAPNFSCANNKISLFTNGVENSYSSIQSAINASVSGDLIYVGSGNYSETLSIVKKIKVSVVTTCSAQIKSVSVNNSADITIDGFRIYAQGLGAPAVSIGISNNNGDESDSENAPSFNVRINLKNNIILGAPSDAVSIRGKILDLNISNNYIHDNAGAGISFSSIQSFPSIESKKFKKDASKSESEVYHQHLLSTNLIYRNAKDGIYILDQTKNEHFRFENNDIVQNGLQSSGYGLKIDGRSSDDSKSQDQSQNSDSKDSVDSNFIFISNIIAINNGQVVKNKSTQDLYLYSGVSSSSSNGNYSTLGIEGLGFSKFVDSTAPSIQILSQGSFLTNKPPYVFHAKTSDQSPIKNEVYLNGSKIFTTSDYLVDLPLTLVEGSNDIKIISTDYFGNSSQALLPTITLDTIPAKILSMDRREGTIYYTNVLPYFLNQKFIMSEPILYGNVNGVAGVLNSPSSFSALVMLQLQGNNALNIVTSDLAGNIGTETKNINLVYDTDPPVVTLGLQDGTLTNQTSIVVPVQVSDMSPIQTNVYVNNAMVYQTDLANFSVNVDLPKEGPNTISVQSIDAAGNSSIKQSITVVRDTTPPTITQLSPKDGDLIRQMSFQIAGQASEPLQWIKVNGVSLTLASGTQFGGSYIAGNTGPLALVYTYADLAGNVSTTTVNISITRALLIPSLVNVVPDQDGSHLWIIGLNSAVRPGASVSVYPSVFSLNRTAGVGDSNGAFQLRLKNFTTATVHVSDSSTGDSAEMTVSAQQISTTLAGIVKDINDTPLPNATISVAGSQSSVVTGATGSFVIDVPPTGDQTLIVDGSTIFQATASANKLYSKTKLSINVGVGQKNIIPSPIYLTPLMLDGSQTPVSSSSAATVNSSYAPGVSLSIPAGVTTFPDGNKSGAINMMTIPSVRATTPTPDSFKPTNVVSLEPSGTQFNQRVQIAVPNDNNLPAKTPMIFLSMNSGKGRWEVDGIGKVSDDGQSVVTNDGTGISHFSLVYAVPLAPMIATMQNPNLVGIDASQGGLTNTISAPSFKVFGQDVTPTLFYKSSWANPTAVVSNIFSVSNYIRQSSGTATGSRGASWRTSVGANCWYVIPGWEECSPAFTYSNAQISDVYNWNSTNLYVPDSIKSQFFVGTMSSDQVAFSNSTLGSAIQQVQNSPASSNLQTGVGAPSQLSGTSIANAVATQIIEQTGIPQTSIVSYAVQLIDPSTGQYLSSGIHPSLARYQIRLQNLTITTMTIQSTTNTTTGGVPMPTTVSSVTSNIVDTKMLDLMPKDLQADILVQNKTNSPAGRGWQVGGASRIYNPTNTKVMVEEANGSVSTYAVNNTISTLYNASSTQIDLNHGVDLSVWPNALAGSTDASQNSFITQINLSSPNSTPANIVQLPSTTGQLGNQGYASCGLTYGTDALGGHLFRSGSFQSYLYPFSMKFQLGGIVQAGNGQIYTTNNLQHSFGVINGTYSDLVGVKDTVDNAVQIANNGNLFNSTPDSTSVNPFCNQMFGFDCGAGQSTGSYDCNLTNTYYGSNTYCSNMWWGKGWSACMGWSTNIFTTQVAQTQFVNSVGTIGVPSANAYGLNNPTFTIGSPIGQVLIADTGNNRVVSWDPTSKALYIIAGNGTTIDNGDGGPATGAGIVHPRGLAYDAAGNLYISSENGFIRKVDTNGIISTFAGLSLVNGGVVADQAPAQSIFISQPQGLVYDNVNNFLYVADSGNNRILQIDTQSNIANKIAGTGQCNQNGDIGDGNAALFANICNPTTIGLDDKQNLLIVDSGHNAIRRVVFSGVSAGLLAYSSSSNDLSRLLKYSDGTWARQYRNGSYDSFDSSGYQVFATDRMGKSSKFTYDSNYNLTQILYPNSQSVNFNYSGNTLASIVDPAGRSTSFSYSSGVLSKVSFPDGTTRKFTYDSFGQMVSETDKSNNTTNYTYNAWNRLATVIHPDTSVETINDIASQTVSNNYTGGTVSPMQAQGFDPSQVNTQLTNGNTVTTKMTTDNMGFISTIKDPLGNITTITRDFQGRPVSIVKPGPKSISMVYDQNTGDLLSTTDNTLLITESKTYDIYGHVLSETDGRGNVITHTYNAKSGLLMQTNYPGTVANPAGTYEAYTYDVNGFMIQKLVYNGSTNILTTYAYDTFGNVSSIMDNGNNTTRYNYDLTGNQLQSISSTNGIDQVITYYTYDPFNRLSSVKSPNKEITQYDYTPNGQLWHITDPKNKVSVFNYDSMGRLNSKTDTNNMTYSFLYDKNGNRKQEIDPNGNVKLFTYDVLNRLTNADFPDDNVVYDYDLDGNIKIASNRVSQIQSVTDSKKQVTYSLSIGLGTMAGYPQVAMNYNYDNSGNRSLLTTGIGRISYNFDSNNRLTSLINSWGDTFNYGYDTAGRLTQISRPGSFTSYSYSNSGTLAQISHTTSVGQDYNQYTYDQRNIPTVKRTPAGSYNYSYDSNGQLTNASNPHALLTPEAYAYDSLGNRLTDELGNNYTYDTNSQRLQDDGVYLYMYDNNGNVTAKMNKNQNLPGYKFSYNSRNQLTQVQTVASTFGAVIKQTDYVYDVLGRRMQKAVQDFSAPLDNTKTYTRLYVYDGQNIFAEYDGSSNLLAQYTHNPLTLDDVLGVSVTTAGVTAGISTAVGNYYYLKDHLGSTTSITNASGKIVQQYDYKSFGKIISITDASGADISAAPVVNTSFTFTGREYDSDTNLFFLRARFLDASTGRFLQQDPEPGKIAKPSTMINKYIYCANNPTAFSDPTGKFFWFVLAIAAIVGVIDGSMVAGNSGFASGSSQWMEAFFAGFVGGAAGTLASAYLGPAAGAFNLVSGFTASLIGGAVSSGLTNAINQGNFGNGHFDIGSFLSSALVGSATAGLSYGVTGASVDKIIMPGQDSVIGNTLVYNMKDGFNWAGPLVSPIIEYIPNNAVNPSGIPQNYCSFHPTECTTMGH